MNSKLKRIVVALFASAVAFVPLSAPASAAPSEKSSTSKVSTYKSGGGVSTRAIDWE